MKQAKKYIVVSILIILTIVAIVSLAIIADAENIEPTEAQIADEETIVRISALHSRGKAADNKVNKDTLEDELNKYAGSGKTTVTEKDSNTLAVTFTTTGNEYEIDVSKGPEFVAGEEPLELPSTEYTTPYLPSADFEKVEGTDLNTGLVIQDGDGNQYVWVEVLRSTTVYDNLNYDLDSLTGTALTDAYTAIETDLKEYTNTYRDGTSYDDIHSGDDTSTGLTSTQYTEKKNKMLKSVYENGGFYVGRYEAGIATNRTDHTEISNTLVPTSKENQYPLTYIYCSEAQTLASRVLPTGEYTSSLMFGVQWDLVLKYLETKGATEEELKGTTTGSTNWGNYRYSTYTLNRGKYAKFNRGGVLSTWYDYTADLTGVVESSVKKSATSVPNSMLCTTGASDQNRKQNIYDLAGNVNEYTLEYTSDIDYPCVSRGGTYYEDGGDKPASWRFGNNPTNDIYNDMGFRVVLY